ncbi:MAG: class I SAM-dependent methyltransferase [Nitrospirota bacterium]
MVSYEAADYHKKRHSEFLNDADLGKAWSCFADFAYFGSIKPGMRVLEFGGGLGYNLLKVKERAEAHMVEPSILGREIAAKSGIVAVKSLDELKGNKYDAILCRHVLEHLEHPKMVLESFRDYLAPHGRLILVVPCERWNEIPDADDINHHLYCWNPQTLNNLLVAAGFKVDRFRFEYYGARRKLIPVFRRFGGNLYARMLQLVGRLFRFRELVFECTL